MTPVIAELRASGFLSPLDAHFAARLGAVAGETRAEVLLAVALVSRQVVNGHVCLDLAKPPVVVDEDGRPLRRTTWPGATEWIAELEKSPLVGSAQDETTPLVLEAPGRLYLRRYWTYQRDLAEALRRRASAARDDVDVEVLRRGLARFFEKERPSAQGNLFDRPGGASDGQRLAAASAVLSNLTVISGGPGTGKTHTVVKILGLLAEQAEAAKRRPPRATLLAPTGKAAARLREAIAGAKSTLAVSDAVRNAIPEEATTIHRGLGWTGTAGRFLYHAANPLFTDVVIVDEASMVDLALMTRLIDAVPERARLILLGDKDQLASVEAGAVLGDICNTGGVRRSSVENAVRLEEAIGERVAVTADAPRRRGIGDSIVELTVSYRYAAASGIGRLARAVNAGDVETALAVLTPAPDSETRWIEPPGGKGFAPELGELVRRGFADFVAEGEPLRRLAAFERFRVLCAHRRGPGGVEGVNALAGEVLGDGVRLAVRPILVTRNDYPLELFNGDVGLITGGVAYFPGKAGGQRALSPARLPPHETAFAMSVHKSQGAEFDQVLVVLPDEISPVVSRELLYTAITRARSRVTIHASRVVLEEAIRRRVDRASGLRDRLWQGASHSDPG